MQVIPFIPPSQWRSTALIVLADFQLEFVSAGRGYAIADADECLANCAQLLHGARELRLPIAHFRQIRSGTHFNRASPFSGWIEAFRPRPNEMLYERVHPSCYDNDDFTAFLNGIDRPTIIMAGLSADQACLATAIDAHRHDHHAILLRDCSASPALASFSERACHDVVCEIIARYADILTLDQLFAQLGLDRSAFERDVVGGVA